jgi:hypothetical protein
VQNLNSVVSERRFAMACRTADDNYAVFLKAL